MITIPAAVPTIGEALGVVAVAVLLLVSVVYLVEHVLGCWRERQSWPEPGGAEEALSQPKSNV